MAEAPLEPEVGGGLSRVDWSPSDRMLRQFGWAALGFTVLLWLMFNRQWPPSTGWMLLFAVGVIFAILAVVRPSLLRWPFVGLSLIAFPIGMVVGEILFAVVFFIVVTPVALWFRVIGRDALHRNFDRSAASYWTAKRRPKDVASYLRQS